MFSFAAVATRTMELVAVKTAKVGYQKKTTNSTLIVLLVQHSVYMIVLADLYWTCSDLVKSAVEIGWEILSRT